MTPTSSSGRLTVGSAVPLSRGASVPTTRSPEAGVPRPPGNSTHALEPLPSLGSASTRVVIRQRGEPFAAEEHDWPWVLPRVGDNVVVRRGVGGFVEYVEFDLEKGIVTISLR